MRGILDAGFVFWGLFLVFGLFVVAYLVWMRRIEKTEDPSAQLRGQSAAEEP